MNRGSYTKVSSARRQAKIVDRDEYIEKLKADSGRVSHEAIQGLQDDIYSLNDKHTQTRKIVEALARAAKIRTRSAATRQKSLLTSLEQFDARILAIENKNHKHLDRLIEDKIREGLKSIEKRMENNMQARLKQLSGAEDNRIPISKLESLISKVREIEESIAVDRQQMKHLREQVFRTEEKVAVEMGSIRNSLKGLESIGTAVNADSLEKLKARAWSSEQTCAKLASDAMERIEGSRRQLEGRLRQLGKALQQNQASQQVTIETNLRKLIASSEAKIRADFDRWDMAIFTKINQKKATADTVDGRYSMGSIPKLTAALKPITDRCNLLESEVNRACSSCDVALRLLRSQSESILKLSKEVQTLSPSTVEPQEFSNAALAAVRAEVEVIRATLGRDLDTREDTLRKRIRAEMRSVAKNTFQEIKEMQPRPAPSPSHDVVENSHDLEASLSRLRDETKGKIRSLMRGQDQLNISLQRLHSAYGNLEDSVKFLMDRGFWIAADKRRHYDSTITREAPLLFRRAVR
ncbi:hypothetical protein AAMO2058_000577800, partial [Amorphochlora amoebiformis]